MCYVHLELHFPIGRLHQVCNFIAVLIATFGRILKEGYAQRLLYGMTLKDACNFYFIYIKMRYLPFATGYV